MHSLEKPSDHIGKRVAYYRKLNGQSAAELSEVTFGQISKGVIANIETGRKKDLTVDELVTLSWALGVPPLALALPIERPSAFINVAENKDDDEAHYVSVSLEARRFVEPAVPWRSNYDYYDRPDTPSGALATSRLNSLFKWESVTQEHRIHQRKLRDARRRNDTDDITKYETLASETEQEVREAEQQMKTFGMRPRVGDAEDG